MSSLIYRVGGDEFVVLTPNLPPYDVWTASDRMRVFLREKDCEVSVGIQNTNNLRKLEAAVNTAEQAMHCVIAYEPLWAIGTGNTATSAQAQEVCASIRATLGKLYDLETAQTISILYGGSMNAGTAAELLAPQDIDGGLIGGASLKPVDFSKIVAATAQGACE